MPETDVEDALLLIASISKSLAAGTPHYDMSGRQLTTAREVIEALLRDGSIEFGDEGRHVP